ncbi:MAG: methyltransferase domain-containing protein [Kangiellaceae bacterium]|nr:methyltransferase domain-containing protein [Kangiellaceae bacterium]
MTDKWWETLYDDLLAKILLDSTSEKDINDTVSFLQNILKVKEGDRVFDQCCGTGRLSLAMARLGHSVFGVDLIDSYIQSAKSHSILNNSCQFICDDAFNYTTPEPVQAAFNWWTSFGYSASDSVNINMIQRAFDSLEAGGRFALDFMNVPGLYRSFQPQVVTRIKEDEGELVLIRESRMDHTTGMMHKTWTYFLANGKKVEHQSQVRLYTPHQLNMFFVECGFQEVVIYGDIDCSELSLSSPRCIVTGCKPI